MQNHQKDVCDVPPLKQFLDILIYLKYYYPKPLHSTQVP